MAHGLITGITQAPPPLREGKGTMFDGGCREPMLAWWPGTIPANSICREPAMTIDLLPTIAYLTKAKLPEHTIDGQNVWPLFTEDGAVSPQEAITSITATSCRPSVRENGNFTSLTVIVPWLENQAGPAGFPPITPRPK